MTFGRLILSCAAALALAVPGLAQTKAPSSKAAAKAALPRVAILKFPTAPNAWTGWRHGGWGNEEGRISDVLQDLFVTELVSQGKGKLRLVERERLNEIRNELNFQQSGEVDTATVQKIGKLLGVKYLVTGKITRFAYKDSSIKGGWLAGALVNKATGNWIASGAAGDTQVGRASFTGRLDIRLIEVETGEILVTAKDESKVADTSVMVGGTGREIEYDQELVNKVFEPIVERMSPKLIKGITQEHTDTDEESE
jgi:curli biogenesis system outer membrane secretion channel CsgG